MSYNDTYYSISVPSPSFDFMTQAGLSLVSASISVSSSASFDANIFVYTVSSSINSTSAVDSSLLIVNNLGANISVTPTVIVSSAILGIYSSANISVTPTFSVSASASQYLTISPSVSASASVLISSIDILSTGILEDTGDIKPFFVIDNIPLTEHNRITQFNDVPKISINENWYGKKGVYFKTSKNKRNFVIEWKMVPGKRENTVDYHGGRDYIKNVAMDPASHILKIRNLDTDGLSPHTYESYNVLVVSYNESLVRRDLNNDEYYWDCSLGLQEV